MKTQYLSKAISSGILALSLITLPVIAPASAQTDTPNSTDSARTSTYNRNDNNNWSWLGLLGLLGLGGLLKPGNENIVRSRDENTGMR